MSPYQVAAGISATDLPSYQRAARLVLRHTLITDVYPRPGMLELVHRWEDPLAGDLRVLFGYRLDVRTSYARLIRCFDRLTPVVQFRSRARRPFDRRRYAYLCLVLAGLRRSYTEISLAVIARILAPQANAVDGLRFDPTISEHKQALADALGFLEQVGALRCSDGSANAWLRDPETGDALYDVDHDLCNAVFRPTRSLRDLPSAGALLTPAKGLGRDARRVAGQRARREVIEYPVTYFDEVDEDAAAALRDPQLAEDLSRLTGAVVERRAEGIALIDPTGTFSDAPFPAPNAVARAAALLLGAIADDLTRTESEATAIRLATPPAVELQAELISRVDEGMPGTQQPGTPTGQEEAGLVDSGPGWAVVEAGAALPVINDARLTELMHDLYIRFGAASFTDTWAADPSGMLAAARRFLFEMKLLAPAPSGAFVMPAAGRYRTIIPVVAPPHDQLLLEIGPVVSSGEGSGAVGAGQVDDVAQRKDPE
ncbi:TIGR02678 family protein [Micromonospora rhizosphaerae]|uniref:TIGR02678 family protein n=1 Tax=Micromonospora rhizosphaerae TaxID=568872 RepID=A0A1C6T417_9ACTN|nr:DUF2398 family protein [Micromonospora rhizosphaerae]SCL36322.1 TIGR02678 family protein [Micromonospora rhizosphaerae]